MKFRTDFVTNSSSSSYMSVVYTNYELTEYLASIGIKIRSPYCEFDTLTGGIDENDEHLNEVVKNIEDIFESEFDHRDPLDIKEYDPDKVIQSGILAKFKELEALTDPSYQTGELQEDCFFELPSGKVGRLYAPRWGDEAEFYWKRPDEFGSISAWMIYCLLQGMREQGQTEPLKEFIDIINEATHDNIKMPVEVGIHDNHFASYRFSFFDKFDRDFADYDNEIEIVSQYEGEPEEHILYDHNNMNERVRSRKVNEDEEDDEDEAEDDE